MSHKKSNRQKQRSKQSQHPNPHQDSGEYHTPDNIHVRGEIESGRSPSLVKEHQTERNEDNSQANKKYHLEKLTFRAIVVYTGVTLVLAILSIISINDSRKHFVKDQRPYVWASYAGMKTFEHTEIAERIRFDIVFANFGKSPAVSFSGRGKVFIGPYAMQQADWWFRDLGNVRFADSDKGSTTVVAPGIPADPRKPVGGGYSTIQSDMAMWQQINDALGRDDYVVMVYRQQYFDIAGNFYWSDMCWSNLATGATKACPHHNEVH
jgi:hypothetical protein